MQQVQETPFTPTVSLSSQPPETPVKVLFKTGRIPSTGRARKTLFPAPNAQGVALALEQGLPSNLAMRIRSKPPECRTLTCDDCKKLRRYDELQLGVAVVEKDYLINLCCKVVAGGFVDTVQRKCRGIDTLEKLMKATPIKPADPETAAKSYIENNNLQYSESLSQVIRTVEEANLQIRHKINVQLQVGLKAALYNDCRKIQACVLRKSKEHAGVIALAVLGVISAHCIFSK